MDVRKRRGWRMIAAMAIASSCSGDMMDDRTGSVGMELRIAPGVIAGGAPND